MYSFYLQPDYRKGLYRLFFFGLPVFIIYIVALSLSKTDLIALPFDNDINPCGAVSNQDLSGYPYIYFGNIDSEDFSFFQTYCVNQCPNQETNFNTINNPSDAEGILKNEKKFIFYDTFPAFNKVCLPTSFYEFLSVEPALQISFIQETFRTVQQQNLSLEMARFIFITGVVCFLLLLFLGNIMLYSQKRRQIVYVTSELFLLGLMITFAVLIGESPSISIGELNVHNEQYANLSNEQEKREFRINLLGDYFYGINTNYTLSTFMLVYFIISLILHGGHLLQQEIKLSEYQQSSINPEIFSYARKIFSDTLLIFPMLIIFLPILTLQAVIFYSFQKNMFAVPQNSEYQLQSLLPFDRYFSSTWQHVLNSLIIYPFFAWVLCLTIKSIEFVCVITTLRQISFIKTPDQLNFNSFSFEDRLKQLVIDIFNGFYRYNNKLIRFAIFDVITIIASFLYKMILIFPILHGCIDHLKLNQNNFSKLLQLIWKYWRTDYQHKRQRKQLLKYIELTQSMYSFDKLKDLIKRSNHMKLLLIVKQFESSLTISISFIMTMIFYLSAYNKNDPEHNPASPSILTLIWLLIYGITSVCLSVYFLVLQTFIIYSIIWEENSDNCLVNRPLEPYSQPVSQQNTMTVTPAKSLITQITIKQDKKLPDEKIVQISMTILKRSNNGQTIPKKFIQNLNNPQANDSDGSTKASEEDVKSYCNDLNYSSEETNFFIDIYKNLKELNGKEETGIQDVVFMCEKNALNPIISISKQSLQKSEKASEKRQKELEEIVKISQQQQQSTQTQKTGNQSNSSQAVDLETSIKLLGLLSVYTSKGFNLLLKDPNDPSSNHKQGSGSNGQDTASTGETYQKMIIMSGQTDGLSYFNFSAVPNSFGSVFLTKEQIVKNLKMDICTCFGVPKESIRLMDFAMDSYGNKVEASFRVPDEFRQKIQNQFLRQDSFYYFKNPCITFSSLIDHFQLSEDLFDSRYNKQWPEAEFKSKKDHRGALPIKGKDGTIKNTPQPYNFPIGWDGFGINMTDIIKWDASGWFSQESTISTWVVLYHATKGANIGKIFAQNTNQNKSSADQKAEIKPGIRNSYGGSTCRINGYPIGGGNYANVYLADNISSCIEYSDQDGYLIGTKKYQFIFQCRVNPHHVRSPQDRPDYYTVEKLFAKDSIRPYRLLVKEKL